VSRAVQTWLRGLAALLSLTVARSVRAEEAAPLPAKDVRWSASLGGAVDAGSLPSASTGLALGFDVRRGGLAARGLTSVFVPQKETSGASVALLDVGAMVCALAPVASWLDAGGCGGGGFGLLRAARGDGARSSSGTGLRLEGLAVARVDLVLSESWALSLEAGTVLDPSRTPVPLSGAGDAGRASLFAFRGVLGILVRVW
jgi:hypothetical protein